MAKNGTTMKASNIDLNAPAGMPPGPPPPFGKDGFPQLPAGRKVMVTAMLNGRARTSAAGQPISALIELLENQLRAAVVDKTGLLGSYDYNLEFKPEPGSTLGPLAPPLPPPPPSAAPNPALPGAANDPNEPPAISVAIQQQLGLRLERKKGPVDVLVIDYAGKTPAEN